MTAAAWPGCKRCARRHVVRARRILATLPLWGLIAARHQRPTRRAPVFYSQPRVGEQGRILRAWKFRSMVADAERDHGAAPQATENDPRVTRIGRLLRATAMDELPQLWNIFRGDMSFVGPRASAR